MCGRFSFVMLDAEILERFGVRIRTAIYKARYNCAPTQNLAVITGEEPEALQYFRWGLIPSWAKDPAIGNKMINARAETIAEKPSFRTALKHRRCLVPATGFFEWKRDTKKIPYNIHLKDGEPFCFAGLWEEWKSGSGEAIRSFTIITTIPNELMSGIHDRMPVILAREDESAWLDPSSGHDPTKLLRPYPSELMEAYPVSTLVNSPANDLPEILEPAVLF